MLKRFFVPVILGLLVAGFWLSPEFQTIAGGVAIFLFGMLMLERGFELFSGGILEKVMKRSTDSVAKSLLFGIFSTTIMQSSSLVSVIAISFLSAGLIPLVAGIGIIFGANIGTTTGAWLVAGFGLKVNLSAFAMPMLVFGLILTFQKSKYLRGTGSVLAGLGFLFLGIHYMKEGFETFRDQIDLLAYAMPGTLGLIVFTMIGAAATVVMQSSHATMVLIITALGSGQITYENALALAIGANVGTTITAILGALTANYQGKQLAAAHLIFNIATAAIALIFIAQLRDAVDWSSTLLGIADNDYTLKLAVFHTIFNVIGVVVMTPLIHRLVELLERAIKEPKLDYSQPRYLSGMVDAFPASILAALRKEVLHLYDNALEILAHGLNLERHRIFGDTDLRGAVAASREVIDFDLDRVYEERVKHLYAAIVEFTTRVGERDLPPEAGDEIFRLRQASGKIVECIKAVKHLRKNLSRYTSRTNGSTTEIYDEIRIEIARLLVAIRELENSGEDERTLLWLDDDRLQIERAHGEFDLRVDRLIRQRQLSPVQATSFMNDSNYAHAVMRNLIDVASTLYRDPEPALREVEQILALEEDELEELSQANANQSQPPRPGLVR